MSSLGILGVLGCHEELIQGEVVLVTEGRPGLTMVRSEVVLLNILKHNETLLISVRKFIFISNFESKFLNIAYLGHRENF